MPISPLPFRLFVRILAYFHLDILTLSPNGYIMLLVYPVGYIAWRRNTVYRHGQLRPKGPAFPRGVSTGDDGSGKQKPRTGRNRAAKFAK